MNNFPSASRTGEPEERHLFLIPRPLIAIPLGLNLFSWVPGFLIHPQAASWIIQNLGGPDPVDSNLHPGRFLIALLAPQACLGIETNQYYSNMSQRIAFLFSGQGAQTVGMGKDLAEQYPAIANLFQRADTFLKRPLSQLMFEGPQEELTQTVHCQPALYVHGAACLAAFLHEMGGELPGVVATAGLSLGEFTAHAAAGTFDFETGLSLVSQRAQFMQEACESTEGTMAAMIGAEENIVRDLAAETDVDIANLNAPGQIVISGERAKVELAVSLAKEHGIRRATLLNVAGAYHSRLMNSAYVRLGEVLEKTSFETPQYKVICNVDAKPVSEPVEIRNALREQVTSSVRWTESMEYLLDVEKIDLFIEFGPGGVLAGLFGRIRKGTNVLSISDVPSLQTAVAALKG